MENFIDKGYSTSILTVLNDVRVFMKVVVLSDILTYQGTKMSHWVLRGGGQPTPQLGMVTHAPTYQPKPQSMEGLP